MRNVTPGVTCLTEDNEVKSLPLLVPEECLKPELLLPVGRVTPIMLEKGLSFCKPRTWGTSHYWEIRKSGATILRYFGDNLTYTMDVQTTLAGLQTCTL